MTLADGAASLAAALEPARIAFNAEGVPYAPAYGDVYHSADGALAQARHVFVHGNDLPQRWCRPGRLAIVETGFGLGANFLATWQAFRAGAHPGARLHYVAVEKHPLAATDLAPLLGRWPEIASLADAMLARWPPLLAGLHRLHFDDDRITLTLAFGDVERLLPRLAARADAFYLDGFAPEKNPRMWSAAVCGELARLAAPGASLATWTVAAAVRERLAAAGFVLDKRPGFGRKREMLVGRHGGAGTLPPAPGRRAVVVGGGMAGTSCAQRLAARGWQVTLVERHGGLAAEASGNPAGVLLPLINLADTPGARLSRACLLYAGRHFDALVAAHGELHWQRSGVLQLARDDADLARHREIFDRLGFRDDFARPVDAEEAAALAGTRVAGEGWFFAQGGWLAPASACAAQLADHDERIVARLATSVSALTRREGAWQVLGSDGVAIAGAPVLILANAADAARLVPGLAMNRVRGQVSLLPVRPDHHLALPVCRRGYATPAHRGLHSVGATFDHDVTDSTPRPADHAANLATLAAMLPEFSVGLDATQLGGRVAFRATTADRLPLVGPVPGHDGVFALAGLGARGLVWAPLAAELLASQLEGDPLPVEAGLAAALMPARMVRRRGEA